MSARACTHLELFPLDAVESAEQVLLVCGFTTGLRTGILSSIGNASRHFEQSVLLDHPGNHLHTSTCRRGGTCECVCVHTHIHVRVPLMPGCTQTSYPRSQTHRHTDTQSLSLARSLSAVFNPRFKASEERHVCVRVCMHGITPSIPPLPISRTRRSDTPDTPRPFLQRKHT